jgi:hypothetical protein
MFIAHRDGNLLSLITDPAALVNNPRMGRHDDENWEALKKGLPKLDSNATLTIKMLPAAPKKNDTKPAPKSSK